MPPPCPSKVSELSRDKIRSSLEDYRLTRILPRKTVGLTQVIEHNDYHDVIRVGPFDVS